MTQSEPPDFHRLREEMVYRQIERRGIVEPRLLAALRKVPRHEYVPEPEKRDAYADGPLAIGHGQTISQPYIVAYMTDRLMLKGDERVLEIGTGSGYQAAVLAETAAAVFTIEIVPELGRRACEILERAGYTNITFRIGSGHGGWPEEAPFDGIIITAAPPADPVHLKDQLKEGGRLIVPVGGGYQALKRFTRRGDRLDAEALIDVRFVPLM